ncbi:MAG: CHAT domain-containing protein [bacterium]|nr:CHAT domain-containing protein [bacterium]
MGDLRLNWSFSEPREEEGELVADFYYQTGKHSVVRLPWPTRRFTGAGDLRIQLGDHAGGAWMAGLDHHAIETGRHLYELLGPEAQGALIRTFANPRDNETGRALVLQFPIPSRESKERCLALEDLPWELLHDGETFISWRYRLQIVRSHARESQNGSNQIQVSSWGILLVTPFVYAGEEQLGEAGLEAIPRGADEVEAVRDLEDWTRGLIRVTPRASRRAPGGVRTFSELESALRPAHGGIHILHFIGHGVMIDDEPCLCFENSDGTPDYVTVARMREMLNLLREQHPEHDIPAILFLNACGSSRRGRYSAGFASGLHQLGLCVLGYQADIQDDDKPILAARRFYQSLCMDQPLQSPHLNPTVIGAVESARRALRGPESDAAPVWGRFRAYLPADITFIPRGRGFVERNIQRLYTRFADWLNPSDYTDHLSLGFLIALMMGVFMGVQNLAFVLPEGVMSRHLTYSEIVSELIRVFLVGPLSFLAAAVFAAWLTRCNHRAVIRRTESPDASPQPIWLCALPASLAAAAAFGFLFEYSFSRLDLLTSQVVAMAPYVPFTARVFWYSLVGLLSGAVGVFLLAGSRYHVMRKHSLHSYGTFYILAAAVAALLATDGSFIYFEGGVRLYRKLGWLTGALMIIALFCMSTIKILKEVCWRASKKKKPAVQFSWRKFLPLLGGLSLLIVCYFWLEESVRFESATIRQAIETRKVSTGDDIRDQRVSQIIERALRQRAIGDVPDSVQAAAAYDWLLSVVYADSILFRAESNRDLASKRSLLLECRRYLDLAIDLDPEAQFKDYFDNIAAMDQILLAETLNEPREKKRTYEAAIGMATRAVAKDERNFAYLDTLARAEARLAFLERDVTLLKQARAHARRAQWSAFFLRSPRAEAVRASIDRLAEFIDEQFDRLESSGVKVSSGG